MDYPIFISRIEVMKILQCKRTKSYETLATIRHLYKYPEHQKRTKFRDFCDYECLDKDEVFRALNSP
jgi:hypothetical protein